MSRDWLTVNFPTDRAISISPRRAAERLSLYLLTRHEAQRRPLSFETMLNHPRQEDGRSKAKRAHVRLDHVKLPGRAASWLVLPDRAERPNGFVAGTFRDAPYEIENALGLEAFLCELCIDTFAVSDLLNPPLRRNRRDSRRLVRRSVLVPLDAVDERNRRELGNRDSAGAASRVKREAANLNGGCPRSLRRPEIVVLTDGPQEREVGCSSTAAPLATCVSASSVVPARDTLRLAVLLALSRGVGGPTAAEQFGGIDCIVITHKMAYCEL
jgi:hypothetical protein